MALGTEAKVKLDGLRQVFSEAGFKSEVETFSDNLVRNGVNQTASFYTGPVTGDGKILISYNNSQGNGYLLFTEDGLLKDPLSDSIVAQISAQAAHFIIGAVFGSGELRTGIVDSAENPSDTILFGGISAASGCFLEGKTCDVQPVKSVKTDIERKKASAEEAARIELERKTKEENERQMAEYLRKGDLIWEKMRSLVQLAREENGIFNRIDEKDLIGIMSTAGPRRNVRNLEDASAYFYDAKYLLSAMLCNHSGHETVYEKQSSLPGCTVVERVLAGGAPSCGSNERSRRGSDGIAINVVCPDIDYNGTHTISEAGSGYCEERNSSDKK